METIEFNIQGVNTTKGLSMYRNKANIYKRLLGDFCMDGNEKYAGLVASFANKDLEMYTTHIHGVRGAADAIAAEAISEAAMLLENAGNNGDWDYITNHHEGFLHELKTLVENVSRLLV